MCAIGRAMMARPKLLMLDEPSMGLAPIFVDRSSRRSSRSTRPARPCSSSSRTRSWRSTSPTAATCSRPARWRSRAGEGTRGERGRQEGVPGDRLAVRRRRGSASRAAPAGTRPGRRLPPFRARAPALPPALRAGTKPNAALPPHPGSRRRSPSPAARSRADRLPVGIGQQRMAGPARAILSSARSIGRGRSLRPIDELGIEPGASRLEERAVRQLCGMGEAPVEPVEEDDRPAFGDGRGLTPQPEGEAEAEIRGQQRVGPLPREIGRCAGDPRQIASSGGSSTMERSRSTAGAPRRGRPTAAPRRPRGSDRHGQRPDDAEPDGARKPAEELCRPRRGDPLRSARVVGIAERRLGDPRLVEGERDPEQRRAARERLLDAERRPPAPRAAGLEQRASARAYFRWVSASAARQQDARPTVDHRLGRAHAHDDVGLDELSCDPLLRPFSSPTRQGSAPRRRAPHLAIERAREGRREQPVELSTPRASCRGRRSRDRLALVGDAEVAQLLDCGADCRPPRVHRRTRQRQSRHVGTIVARPPFGTMPARGAPDSGKRTASRTASPTSVIACAPGLGRHEDDGVVGRLDDDDPRSGEQRDAHSLTLDSRREPEDDHRRGARPRRRAGARVGALPGRRQQSRLPRVFRAPRGAGDEQQPLCPRLGC